MGWNLSDFRFSLGPLVRPRWLLFEKAMGPGIGVGIIALPDREFDPQRWWASSAGVRGVISELIAYAYARTLFRPVE